MMKNFSVLLCMVVMGLCGFWCKGYAQISESAAVDSLKQADAQRQLKLEEEEILRYGSLYHRKAPAWQPALEVVASNAALVAVDRVVFKFQFSKISLETWEKNLKSDWVWDKDKFGMNFFNHPYSGGQYYNAARARGYSFYESIPFVFGGSLLWEYFGENTPPSKNDLYMTTVNGAFLGEVLYRLSSDVLDDQTTGGERVRREIAAAIIAPTRLVGRALQGDLWRVTKREVYEKAPVNLDVAFGVEKVNNGSETPKRNYAGSLNAELLYGDRFQDRQRKPFDYFKLWTDINYADHGKFLDYVKGYGVLVGNNVHTGKNNTMVGVFQHFDYYNSKVFELGAATFSLGEMSQFTINDNWQATVNGFAGIIPLAGNSNNFRVQPNQRRYNYGSGAQVALESEISYQDHVALRLLGYYYLIYTISGIKGNHAVYGTIPRLNIRLYKNISLALEHLQYYSDRDVGKTDYHASHFEEHAYLEYHFGVLNHEK